MPAPIVIRNLTPETKRVPNPPEGQPVIATKAEMRDGSRVVTGGTGEYIPFGQPGGTIDTAFSIDNFVYQGAFRYKLVDATSMSDYSRGAFGYRPPDGSNGVNGSFFFDSVAPRTDLYIAEAQVPDTFSMSTTQGDLPLATNFQGFVDLKAKAPTAQTDAIADSIGWMHVIDGRLWVCTYKTYSLSSNTKSVMVFDNPADLANSTAHGFFELQGQDLVVNYCSELPQEYKTLFGATHLVGNHFGMSIASRLSQGPSLYTFEATDYTGAQTTIPTTMQMGWPYSSNRAMGDTLYPSPAGNFWNDDHWDAFNEGTSLHYYRDTLGFTTYEEWRLSSPRTDWSTLPKPAESKRNDLMNLIGSAWVGFIVPGTDTFLVLGGQAGNEFGTGYKQQNFQNTSNKSGGGPLDANDRDYYYWAFNMNEITTAVDVKDVLPFEYGRFDNNRWKNQVAGLPSSGHFDAATNRLFLVTPSNSTAANVVSVYQLGA